MSPESAGSRSTARPPTDEAAEKEDVDLAAAIRVARTNESPGRYGPPAATAKIQPFQLAEALARLSADHDPSSMPPAPESEGSKEAVHAEVVKLLSVPTAPEPEPEPESDSAEVKEEPEPAKAEENEEAPAPPKESVDKESVDKSPAVVRVSAPGANTTYFILAIGLVLLAIAYVISNR